MLIMNGDFHKTELTAPQHPPERDKSGHSSNLGFYISLIAAVLIGLLLQMTITKFLEFRNKNADQEIVGGDPLFSKPPRQQGLVRFPPDVSWFTLDSEKGNSGLIKHDLVKGNAVKSHAALDARTIQNVKRKLEAKGMFLCNQNR